MNCEIIAVGTELLLGQIVNSNASRISQRMAECGVDVFYHTTVGDNPQRIKQAFKSALERSDVVIATGGLGPTDDDLTKEMLAELLGLKMQRSEDAAIFIADLFKKMNRTMTANNLKQAFIPEGSSIIPNGNGTAPGIHLRHNGKDVFLLPGPPSEMNPMLENYIIPKLKDKTGAIIYSQELYFAGIGESALENEIRDLLKAQSNPTVAPLAAETYVKLRITAKAELKETAAELVKGMVEQIEKRSGEYIFSRESKSMPEVVLTQLKEKGLKVAFAESCTGGRISSEIVNISGASEVFVGSIVAYDNAVKENVLNVPKDTLRIHGAVSPETAIFMAKGVRTLLGSDIGISVTGIAGPSGGTDEKPVGLCFIALVDETSSTVIETRIVGNREKIRARASFAALSLLWKHLSDKKD